VFSNVEDKYNTQASAEIAALVENRFQRIEAVPPFQVFRRVEKDSPERWSEDDCGPSRVSDE
jgi:hypothetical protein